MINLFSSSIFLCNSMFSFLIFLEMAQHPQYRSFSLTGPGAAQLSQSVKERFGSGTHSLPKPGLDMHVYRLVDEFDCILN